MPATAQRDQTTTPEPALSGLTVYLPPVRHEDRAEIRRVGQILYTPGVLPRWGEEIRYVGLVGAGVPIKLTPWLVWVDLPSSDVLAPAYRFLRDMTLAGLLLALVGGLVALLISRDITKPLRDITRAAKGIAAQREQQQQG